MKRAKRIFCAGVCACLAVCAAFAKGKDAKKRKRAKAEKIEVALEFDEAAALKDAGSAAYEVRPQSEMLRDMGEGWNLGNTFDALGDGLSSEVCWGQPMTTREMIDGIAKSGIKTIRIPVSWARHARKSDCTIDAKWMARVKEVVDWAIDDGLFVIINAHHDNAERPGAMRKGDGYYPNSANVDESMRFLLNVWTQIALAFNNGYGERLIFETMNEPRPRGTEIEWWNQPGDSRYKPCADALNKMNQTAVDAIRATGGNNSVRLVMCPALRASTESALTDAFRLPRDSAQGRLALSVHAYSPNNFAMASPGDRKFTAAHRAELESTFSRLNEKFVENGVGVIVGEYGATNKDNLDDRVAWFKAYMEITRQYNMPCCLWDNGAWQVTGSGSDRYSEKFGYYSRTKQEWFFPEILDAIVN